MPKTLTLSKQTLRPIAEQKGDPARMGTNTCFCVTDPYTSCDDSYCVCNTDTANCISNNESCIIAC